MWPNRSFLQIWAHFLKGSLMKKLIYLCAMIVGLWQEILHFSEIFRAAAQQNLGKQTTQKVPTLEFFWYEQLL